MKWIPIKDKTPADYEKENQLHFCSCEAVLIMAQQGSSGPAPLVGIGIWDGKGWDILGNMGAHMDTGYYDFESKDVTHWMPIP
jgi:hypothetical protein